jgi:uncharacterized protein (TIGR02646 family)
MRPIERGSCPIDTAGVTKEFREYQEARGDLITRLGEYCSFCETPLGASLAVEHMLPKKWHPHLEKDWNNFLLACTNCNSTKGYKKIVLADYYWPDRDNTFRAFIYLQGGIVRVNPNLTDFEQQQALKTLQLTGLDRMPGNDPAMKDRRWLNRRKAWDIAERSLQNLKRNNTPSMREQIVDTATTRGFWSVWMSVFRDDTDMLERFINAFEGTCRLCFDDQFKLVPRPGGAL